MTKRKNTELTGEDAYAPLDLPKTAAAKKKAPRKSAPWVSAGEPTGKIIPLQLNQTVTDNRKSGIDPSFLKRAMDKLGHDPECSRRQPSDGTIARFPFDPDCARCREIIKTIPKPKARKKVKS